MISVPIIPSNNNEDAEVNSDDIYSFRHNITGVWKPLVHFKESNYEKILETLTTSLESNTMNRFQLFYSWRPKGKLVPTMTIDIDSCKGWWIISLSTVQDSSINDNGKSNCGCNLLGYTVTQQHRIQESCRAPQQRHRFTINFHLIGPINNSLTQCRDFTIGQATVFSFSVTAIHMVTNYQSLFNKIELGTIRSKLPID